MPKGKPNILVIMGDDIGYWNISAYNQGMMGYETPNIERIGKEGAIFTDCYAQQSCTAGRAAFITGQSPARTGLTKIGMPGGKEGIQPDDPTLAELLRPLGYRCGQFGKNHLGDRDEHLPTVHGFEEFFGNLYHLNAEQEPEYASYPKDPEFKKKFGPRGVMRSKADGKGGQTVEDTGPLTMKRMETIDEEVLDATFDFLDRQDKDTPFFVWFNTTRMHIETHLKAESQDKTGFGIYADGMVEHDGHVGRLLDKIDEMGIADDTIVIYTTDNGAEAFSWPDGGTTPFRGEKNTNWEGGYRVPFLVRWPGTIKPGTRFNGIFSLEDLVPTLMDAAGVPDVKEQLLEGYAGEFKTFKVHLDGYNVMPFVRGEVDEWPRHEFFYWTDDADLAAMRYDQYKIVYMKQNAEGLAVWREPLIPLRAPEIYSLRADPFERTIHEAGGYDRWFVGHMWAVVPATQYAAKYLQSFVDFPPRQEVGSFNISSALDKMKGMHSKA